MSIEVMKLALEYLQDNQHLIADNERHAYVMEYNAFIDRFKEAIEQAQKQEPVIDHSAAVRIATALGWEPKREWVGLTVDEMAEILLNSSWKEKAVHYLIRETEDKLKEKNNAS